MAELYIIEGPTGRNYVGVTSQDAAQRYVTHCRNINSKRFTRIALQCALRKYGIENFSPRTLVVGSWDYVLSIEDAAILTFNTLAPNGYNTKRGGAGGPVIGEARQRQINSSKKIATDAAVQDKKAASVKAAWANPEIYERKKVAIRDGVARSWNDPSRRERRTANNKRSSAEKWSDPVFSTEERARRSQRSIVYFSSPAAREKVSNSAKLRWTDEQYRLQQSQSRSETMKRRWADPQYRLWQSTSMKQRWQSEDYRAYITKSVTGKPKRKCTNQLKLDL